PRAEVQGDEPLVAMLRTDVPPPDGETESPPCHGPLPSWVSQADLFPERILGEDELHLQPLLLGQRGHQVADSLDLGGRAVPQDAPVETAPPPLPFPLIQENDILIGVVVRQLEVRLKVLARRRG